MQKTGTVVAKYANVDRRGWRNGFLSLSYKKAMEGFMDMVML